MLFSHPTIATKIRQEIGTKALNSPYSYSYYYKIIYVKDFNYMHICMCWYELSQTDLINEFSKMAG